MENTVGLRVGDNVLVRCLTETESRFNLDRGTGNMKRMVGKVFPIYKISGHSSIRIYHEGEETSYIFDIQDIERPEIKELEPKIFQFDTQYLDI